MARAGELSPPGPASNGGGSAAAGRGKAGSSCALGRNSTVLCCAVQAIASELLTLLLCAVRCVVPLCYVVLCVQAAKLIQIVDA